MDFKSFYDLIVSLEEVAAREGEAACPRLLEDALKELTTQRKLLSAEEDQREMVRFQELLHPLILQSSFCARVFHKPRGHAGDYVGQEAIWFGRTLGGEYRYRGQTVLGRLLSALTLDMANCVANEERILRLKARIGSAGLRIANFGCGSAIEYWNEQAVQDRDLLLLDRRADKGKVPSSLGNDEDAEQAHDPKTEREGGTASVLIVEQARIGMKFQGERDGFGFAGIEPDVTDAGGNDERRLDFDPGGQCGVGATQFGVHGGRDNDALKKLGEQVGQSCLQERGDRRGVADDEHGSAASEQYLDGPEVFGEIFHAVVHRDFAPAEFVKELRLVETGDLRGLPERDFTRGVKANGEVKCGLARRGALRAVRAG